MLNRGQVAVRGRVMCKARDPSLGTILVSFQAQDGW